jgi:hypothetical protein
MSRDQLTAVSIVLTILLMLIVVLYWNRQTIAASIVLGSLIIAFAIFVSRRQP